MGDGGWGMGDDTQFFHSPHAVLFSSSKGRCARLDSAAIAGGGQVYYCAASAPAP